jgi:uncharacterized protein YjbI with pentapeptide repeats
MANAELLRLLKSSSASQWNRWKADHFNEIVDFRKANLSHHNLTGFDLRWSDLRNAKLDKAFLEDTNLFSADLSGASLLGATLARAHIVETKFVGADLRSASLRDANVKGSALDRANLTNADLRYSRLIYTSFAGAILDGASVFGTSVWNVDVAGASQCELIVTDHGESLITTDSLEMAQFLHLLITNTAIRNVIDTITSKVVLILGRFTPDRKAILNAIRDELRKWDYLPVLFDFDKPANRDITETVSMLAHMARFVIADITDAKSIPQELMRIVPALPSVPVQPLLLASQREYGMFDHFRRYPSVLEPFVYEDQDGLLMALTDRVIGPAEAKAGQLRICFSRQ